MPSVGDPGYFVHPTALIEKDVRIGRGSSVWDHVHVRRGASIGEDCIIGGKTYIAYDVRIGNRVKINSMVYICAQVTVEDGVMISAGTIFTNDKFPRACVSDLSRLRPSEPDDETLSTTVRRGATIGAGCVIGCGFELGEYCMVGMGSVVTRAVPPHHLVFGQPARSRGAVCRCGHPLFMEDPSTGKPGIFSCEKCGDRYRCQSGQICLA